jgi:chromosome segregation ATPase
MVCGLLVGCKFFPGNDDQNNASNSKKTNNQQSGGDPTAELKEVVHLTNMLRKVEKGVNEIYDKYDIIQLQNNAELPLNSDEQLLSNINNLQIIIDNNRAQIAALKNEINSLKSTNKEVREIKLNYLKMVDEKNLQIEKLVEKTMQLEAEITQRDLIIEENKQVISKQNATISDQRTKIEILNQKHVIIYSRKKTNQYTLEGSIISIPEKERNITLISEHPAESFQLRANGKENCDLIIYDANKFWNGSNYVIIKVRKLE